jgi:hypothetical protein
MGIVLTALPRRDARNVTLAELGEAVERAMRECIEQGVDPATVEPTVLLRIGGKIKKVSIEV